MPKYQHRVSAAFDADLVDDSLRRHRDVPRDQVQVDGGGRPVDRNDQLKYTKAMGKIRDNKLTDNVTAQGFWLR